MDEYGVAKWNLERGLLPPETGSLENWFKDGMGAAIRSEIWACLFPGQPGCAATFTSQDAMIDHSGDDVWAEMFLAATESACFVTQDLNEALDSGLSQIPADCRLAQSVRFARRHHADDTPLKQV
jgi:hypothetical protein